MTTMTTTLARRSLRAIAAGTMLSLASIAVATAAEPAKTDKPAVTPAQEQAAAPAPAEHYQVPRQEWTFGGLTGYFDEQQLRRGFKIYKNVCSNCHNMRY